MSDQNNAKQPTVAPANTKVVKIPGVSLRVSVGKEVVVRLPGTDRSYKGRVVGYDPYEYIIVTVRIPSTDRKKLSYGGEIILKYVHEGTVYGFKTYVLTAMQAPPLVLIEYPAAIEKIELRRESRREVNIDATLHTQKGPCDCLVVNLSTTGCKISARATSKDPLYSAKVDDTMVVSVNLGAEGAIKVPIAVRNIKRGKGIVTIGAMFLDIFKKEEELIATYLERVQRMTR